MKLYPHHLSQQHALPAAVPVVKMNTAPLIGTLLILVVMLVITFPVPSHSIRLSMPSRQVAAATGEVVRVKIDANGFVEWNDARLEKLTDLTARIALAAKQRVQPEIHLQPSPDSPYAFVSAVLVTAKKAGLQKVRVVN